MTSSEKSLLLRLNSHIPLVILPNGEENTQRVIAEGFIHPKGFFFFDIGWNQPLAGTGLHHFIPGKVTGPYAEEEYQYTLLYWKIGDSIIKEITAGDELYIQADRNRAEAIANADDEYESRERAEVLYRDLVREFVGD